MKKLSYILIFSFVLLITECDNNTHPVEQYIIKDKDTFYSSTPGPDGKTSSTMEELYHRIKHIFPDDTAGKNYTVAIAMHDVKNDWSKVLLKGIQTVFDIYNIEVLVITDGEFSQEKQIADIKNIISLNPDVLITLPLHREKTAAVLKKAANAGIELIFIDTKVSGLIPGKDFYSWAVGDAYRMGTLSAEVLAEHFHSPAQIALLRWTGDMFTVNQRSRGAKDYFQKNSNCIIVKEIFFTDFYEIPALIENLLEQYPDLKGLWTVWDTPAIEAIKTIQSLNADIIVSTCDLSREAAILLSEDSPLVGTSVDNPFYLGIMEGLLSLAALELINISEYYVVHADKVTKENLYTAWEQLYHEKLYPDQK